MQEPYPIDRNIHRPRHIYADDAIYGITAAVYNKERIINTPPKRIKLIKATREILTQFHYHLYAWVILPNHYHLLIKSNIGLDLPVILNKIHAQYALWLNKEDKTKGRKIFYQYWDQFFEGEHGFFRFMNYIHFNPVKHQYVKVMEEWDSSSVRFYIKRHGQEAVYRDFEQYPLGEWSFAYDNEL